MTENENLPCSQRYEKTLTNNNSREESRIFVENTIRKGGEEGGEGGKGEGRGEERRGNGDRGKEEGGKGGGRREGRARR